MRGRSALAVAAVTLAVLFAGAGPALATGIGSQVKQITYDCEATTVKVKSGHAGTSSTVYTWAVDGETVATSGKGQHRTIIIPAGPAVTLTVTANLPGTPPGPWVITWEDPGDCATDPDPDPTVTPTPDPDPDPDPTTEPTPEPDPTVTPSVTPTPVVVECVDVNTADVDTLQLLTHIGPERAQQIITLRPFTTATDLARVDGIALGGVMLVELVTGDPEATPPVPGVCPIDDEEEPTTEPVARQLPVTGPSVPALVIAAAGALVAGSALFLVARRQRRTFTA